MSPDLHAMGYVSARIGYHFSALLVSLMALRSCQGTKISFGLKLQPLWDPLEMFLGNGIYKGNASGALRYLGHMNQRNCEFCPT